MKLQFDITLISKYRTQLMGIAMLWIMIFHSGIHSEKLPFIIRLINKSGYGGVDIFFLLSGLGVYFAYNKETKVKLFLLKRLLRILPYYIPVIVLYALLFQYPIGEIDVKGIFFRIFLLDYFVGKDAYALGWYIPVAILFYFLTPLIISVLKKSWDRNCVLLILLVFSVGFLFYYCWGQWWIMSVICVRLGTYILGIYIGHMIAEKGKINIIWIFFFLMIGTALYALFYRYRFDIEWINIYFDTLPFFFLALPICICISYVLSLFKNYKFPFLYFIGTYTLCIYIFHERLKLIMLHYDLPYATAIAFFISIPTAFIWQNIVSKGLEKTKITDWLIRKVS